jgi:hypothetical protein
MIPTAAVFVICDDDYTVLPNLALLHRGDEIATCCWPVTKSV